MDRPNGPTFSELIADHAGTEAALRKAAREAVLDHARAGNPVCTWRDGKSEPLGAAVELGSGVVAGTGQLAKAG